jgi:hypothetical protein
MTRRNGGANTEAGIYFSPEDWSITPVSGLTGALPLPAERTWVRLPGPLVLLVAPLLGAALVVFLPVAGFALLFATLGEKALRIAREARGRVIPFRARDDAKGHGRRAA